MQQQPYEQIVAEQAAAPLVDPVLTQLPADTQALVDHATALCNEPSVCKRFRMGKRCHESVVATMDEMNSGRIPLHIATVPVLNESAALQLMLPAAQQRFADLIDDLRAFPVTPTPLGDVAARHDMLVPAALADQLAAAVGAFVTEEEAATMHPTQFFGVKEQKSVTGLEATQHIDLATAAGVDSANVTERIRPIMWPRDYLSRSQYRSEMSLDTAASVRHLCATASSTAAFDIRCSYWHVRTAGNFVLRCEDGRYIRVDVMLFGIDNAAEIMQLITEAVAGRPNTAADPARIPVVVHIDNAMAGGDEDEVSRWCASVRERAHQCNIELNVETCNEPSTRTPFCGMVVDSVSKTCALGPKFMVKFAASVRHFDLALSNGVPQGRSVQTTLSAQDLISLHSRLLYASAVLGINTALHVNALWAHKFIRRLAAALNKGTVGPHDALVLSRSVVDGFHKLISLCAPNDPAPVTTWPQSWCTPDGPAVVLTTDATPSSWGAVLHRPGHLPRSIGGVFPEQIPIHIAEAVAVFVAVKVFYDDLRRYERLLLLVDNTTALAAIRNTAQDESVRYIATEVRQALNGMTIEAAYIKTSDNRRADWASRFFLPTRTQEPAPGRQHAQGRRAAAPATVR